MAGLGDGDMGSTVYWGDSVMDTFVINSSPSSSPTQKTPPNAPAKRSRYDNDKNNGVNRSLFGREEPRTYFRKSLNNIFNRIIVRPAESVDQCMQAV